MQEDDHGRWRDFPLHLQSEVESQFQTWKASGAPGVLVVEFVWPNAKNDGFTPYEIECVNGFMRQRNKRNGHLRDVRRLVMPSGVWPEA